MARITGQGLLPLPSYPRAQRPPLQPPLSMGLLPGLVRRRPHRDINRLRCLPRGHWRRNHQRLEDWVLHQQPPRQP
jgi:hypothetical protein